MNVTPISSMSPAQVQHHAEQAADHDHGAGANPFPHDSQMHAEWQRHFAARVRENAVEAAV